MPYRKKRVNILTPECYAPPGPFVHAVVVGDTIYTTCLGGIDPKTNKLPDDLVTQTEQAFKNIEAVLKSAGFSYKEVVKATIFTTDLSQYDMINKVMEKYMEGNKPARTAAEVSRLPLDMKIKIEVIAVKTDKCEEG